MKKARDKITRFPPYYDFDTCIRKILYEFYGNLIIKNITGEFLVEFM